MAKGLPLAKGLPWRSIEGYDGLYEISSNGLVRNSKGLIIKSFDNGRGYKQVVLSKNGNVKAYKIHRLVAMMFIDNPDNKPCVDHINGDRYDNNVCNLRWVTYKENNNNPVTKYNRDNNIHTETSKHSEYRERNKDKIREYSKRYFQEHKEERREYKGNKIK